MRADQYRQVAEWEYGPQPDADWDKYAAEMNEPQWLHYGLYLNAEFVGCISLEKTGRNIAEGHVVTARRKVHPQALAEVLLATADYLFSQGFLAVTAHVPREKREVARLAIRCGLKEWGHTPMERFFMLTKVRRERDERTKAEADSHAI